MKKDKALTKYFKENYNTLVKIARRRVGNYSLELAEEAVQEAFFRACKYYKAYNENESFDNWFRGILYNCINQIKRDERNGGAVNYSDIDDYHHTEMKDIIFSKEIEEALDNSSIRDQKILNMYFFDGWKSREISEFLIVSHDVVRDVIRRFRMKVKT